MKHKAGVYLLLLGLLFLFGFIASSHAEIILSAEQGNRISADYAVNSQFSVKVFIDNSSSRIKSLSMVVDYGDRHGLDYEMYAVGTRNPDGTDAKADKWTTLTSLEKEATRHQWQVGYVANTLLESHSRFCFLELYFSLKPDHRFQPGDVIDFIVRDIEIVSESGAELPTNERFPVHIVFSPKSDPVDSTVVKLTGEQGYGIGPDIKKFPEFMVKYFVADFLKPIRQMEMDVEYSMPEPLAFELYACGTRFSDGTDAKNNWWASLDFTEKSVNRHKAHMLFEVAQGDPIMPGPSFNFLQQYFRFTRGDAFKGGETIAIKISNVKVRLDGEANCSIVPDFVVNIKIDEAVIDTTVKTGPKITGEQAYKIGPDIKKSPEFMVKYFVSDLAKPMKQMEMDIEYSMTEPLAFELYACGTRFPDGSEAKDNWWTFLNFTEKSTNRHQAHMLFKVGLGDPVMPGPSFNFLQQYFRFIRAGAFKGGETIAIKISNVKIQLDGEVSSQTVPDFIVYIKIDEVAVDTTVNNSCQITGEQGYKIGPDIKKSPEFMVKYFVSGLEKPMNQMEMDIEYSMSEPLAFELYACGTRFPDGSEAKDNWWTFMNFTERSLYHHKAHMLFKVGLGDPVMPGPRFNFLQQYFRFTRGGAFKNGDIITIKISNVKVQLEGETNGPSIPDFIVIIRIDDGNTTGINDIIGQAISLAMSPNPATDRLAVSFVAKAQNAKISVVDMTGAERLLLLDGKTLEGENNFSFDVSRLTTGAYFLVIDFGLTRQLSPLRISH